jgi:hypothetical protein
VSLFKKAFAGSGDRIVGNNRRINIERRSILSTEELQEENDAIKETMRVANEYALKFAARPVGERDQNGDVVADEIPKTREEERALRRRLR